MHTAPHPTLGEIKLLLAGSKGLFRGVEPNLDDSESLIPWISPEPTSRIVLIDKEKYVHLGSMQVTQGNSQLKPTQRVSPLLASNPHKQPNRTIPSLPFKPSQKRQSSCINTSRHSGKKTSGSQSVLKPQSRRSSFCHPSTHIRPSLSWNCRPEHTQIKPRQEAGNLKCEELRRPPIALRTEHLRILALGHMERHLDVPITATDVQGYKTCMRISTPGSALSTRVASTSRLTHSGEK